MSLGIIIQARIKATRLPSKLILPFNNDQSVLDIILTRIKEYVSTNLKNVKIILATSTNPADNVLIPIAKKYNIEIFRGDEHNVLNRFIDCSLKYNLTKIIRICADNPFLSTKYLHTLISFYFESKKSSTTPFDYISFTLDNKIPTIREHIGLFSEYTTLSTLLKIRQRTDNKYFYEHVTNYIYTYPHLFKIKLINFNNMANNIPDNIANNLKNIRLTLDTEIDYLLLKELYKKFILNNYDQTVNIDDLICLLNENNLKIMNAEIIKNQK